jgi:hypothetical protein
MTFQLMEDYFHDRVRVDARASDKLRASVTFTFDLQGPPEVGHGGGVTAMLFEMVRMLRDERGDVLRLPRAVRIEVALHRGTPLGVPLVGEVVASDDAWHSRILREGRPVAEAVVSAMREPLPVVSPEIRREWEAASTEAYEVPGYQFCLGCGLRNARGAQVRFDYNERFMWKQVVPQAHFGCADGTLFHGYLCIVCDEIGWWLGALRQGECGLSNRVTVCVDHPVAHGVPLLVLGNRSAVTSSDLRGRVWQSKAMIVTADWQPVATSEVQFVGSPAFTKTMLPGFAADGNPAALWRAFPRYADRHGASESAVDQSTRGAE